MHGEAARQRAFAAATFHGGHCDDHVVHLPVTCTALQIKSAERISAANGI
jgi:hypothetical protein